MSAFVTVTGLVFDYGNHRALDGVSFELSAGSVVALVGPNGAGKTTLLRCLAGLEEPLAGSVVIDGLDVADHPRAVHAKLGFQQDFFGVYDGLSVRANLLHAAAVQGLSEAQIVPSALAAAQAVGLEDRLDQPAGALSRGLRQRLAIARAIVHRPPLLLLDEPASGLDPEARRDLSGLIRRLQSEGLTIIVSSHILAELEDYSTHMLALRDGRATGPLPLGHEAATRRWRLTVLGDPAVALTVLSGIEGVSATALDAQGLTFALAGGPEAQSALLRQLIEAGVAVSSCAPDSGHLEKLYLSEGKQP
jgi:ABC-2 type transport system ATP-binding protein